MKSQVRYLIQDRVSPMLIDSIDYSNDDDYTVLSQIIETGIELINMVKKIHDLGIVHGDIHANNIGYLNGHLVLIDFGLSQLVVDSFESFQSPNPRPHLNPLLLSPWQLIGGSPISFRDDIYRVAEVISVMLTNGHYIETLRSLSNRRNLGDVKISKNIFESSLDNWDIIDIAFKDEIESRLGDFIAIIQRMESVYSIPDYQELVEILESILLELRSSRKEGKKDCFAWSFFGFNCS